MAKNYFTDEQVRELIEKTQPKYVSETSIDDLKALMNLAVETAIGEPFGFVNELGYNSFTGSSKMVTVHKSVNVINNTPLYKVKELDN